MESLVTEAPSPAGPTSSAHEVRTEHFDVLIVGAGISGVGSAYHLKTQSPGKRYVVLESQESFGGTWLSHRFPGIRSDSDLYTFGYRFKPWVGPPIAAAAEIRKYMGAVIEENDLAGHIRYGHKVQSAVWSSADNRWTITAEEGGRTARFTANFLWMCQGYFRHGDGHTPDWPGMDSFKGVVAHPENWPSDLDYKKKRVVIIGSGATAATMAPAMAAEAAHVTVLQRSPTYYVAVSNSNEFHELLKPLGLDEHLVHDLVRRKIVTDFENTLTRRSFDEPEALTKELLAGVEAFVGPEIVAKHFTPSYRPWRQRIAMLPDGDMLQAIQAGTVSMVTDHIDRFTPEGILLKSGEVLEADIIATATGFHLNVLGDIDFVIDGEPLAFHETVTYRGVMFTGVPNMAWVFGYLRNSWTLRTELVADFVCRLLSHMDEKGAKRVEVALRQGDHNMPRGPWIDPENFNAGYVMRGQHRLPQSGDKAEWRHTQDYWSEKTEFPAIDLDDEVFQYR